MKQTDRALLLRKVNYGESSLVLQLFCLQRGMKSFLYKGAKKKKGQTFIPLAFLEITYFERNESQLAQITAADHVMFWSNSLFDPRKTAVLFFLCDLLQSCMKAENIPQEDLFMFLSAELLELDQAPFQANYPIYFLMVMTRFFGFEPAVDDENPHYFDMHEGIFSNQAPRIFQMEISKAETQELALCFCSNKDQILAKQYSRASRQRFMRILLDYYSYHISGFTIPKSLKILEEVFD
jgi:DNA repair protein RecO (recombination protein O)